MARLLVILASLAFPLGALAACLPEDAKTAWAAPSTAAGAFADAVAAALRQHLSDIDPLPAPVADGLTIVVSRASVPLLGGKASVTRGRDGDWHIALGGDAAYEETAFLAELERTAIFLPELVRQRRIFRRVATFVAVEPPLAESSYILRIDPTPEAGAALHLRAAGAGAERSWTHRGYADSLRRIEDFARHGPDAAAGS